MKNMIENFIEYGMLKTAQMHGAVIHFPASGQQYERGMENHGISKST